MRGRSNWPPDFPAALAGLADCYTISGLYSLAPVPEMLSKARAAIERALALDDGCAEAYLSLGMLHMFLDWDWPTIERVFGRALALTQDSAIARAYYALALAMTGRDDDAVR